MSTTERSTAESIRSRGPATSVRRRAAGSLLIGVVAALALALGGAAPASAAGFSITSHADGDFVSGRIVTLAGSGADGSRVTITGGGASCGTVVSGDAWSCALDLPDGGTTLTATQTPPDAARPAPPAPDATTDPQPTPSLAPAPGVETATVTLRVLGAPAISGADPIATSGLVSGTSYPNAGIRLRSGDRTLECPAAGADGVWTCPVSGVADGTYAVSVLQHVPGSPAQASPWSAPRGITLDTVVPTAPAITSPSSGAQLTGGTVTFGGVGEAGASLDVFATGQLLCRVPVVGGTWSCAAQPPDGDQVVQAVQRDAAGNYSPPSGVLRMTFGVPVPRSPQPAPAPRADPVPQDVAPGAAPAPADPAPAAPAAPGLPGSAAAPGAGWGAPTGFGAALPTAASGAVPDQGLIGLLVAAAFILLVALPLRLALPVVAARLHWRSPRIFGRNSVREPVAPSPHADGPPIVPALPRLVAVVLGATALIALAIGIEGEARYARMVIAIAIGVAVVNLVGIGVAALVAGRVTRTPVRWRIVGPFLVAAAVATLVSRALSIEPPLVVGAVVAGLAVAALGTRRAAVVALAQLGATAALATTAWVTHPLAAGLDGGWGAALGETLAAICIAGFGSLPLLLLPIGSLPGRAVFEWSMPVWAGCSVVAVGLAGAALAVSGGTIAAIVLVGLGVAALSMGAWAWVRWVEPALAARG